MPHPADRNGAAGFTLLETIVAMAVLAIVLVSALRVVTDGGWRVDRAAHRLALARIAERLITRTGVDLTLTDVPLTGTEGGARWRLERSRYVVPDSTGSDEFGGLSKLEGLGSALGDKGSKDPSAGAGLDIAAGDELAAGPGDAMGLSHPGASDRPARSTGSRLADLETRGKLGLWLVRATVEDASGERVALSTLRLEPSP